MGSGPGRAARSCVLTDARRRARSWLALAALFGALCGAATAAVVGAGRTGSAFDRLGDRTLAADLFAVAECSGESCVGTADRLEELPSVAAVAPAAGYLAAMTTRSGTPLSIGDDACYTGAGEIDLLMPVDGRFGTTVNRFDLAAGTIPDPSSTNEVMIAAGIARRFDLGVGDELLLQGSACEEAPAAAVTARTLRIVGVERSAFEQQPDLGFYLLGVHGTTALLHELRREGIEFAPMLAIRLHAGEAESVMLEQATAAGLRVTPVLSLEESARGIAKSTRPDAVALLLLGAFAILAALAVVGPAVIQQAAAIGPEVRILRTLGFTRTDLLRLGLFAGLAAGLASSVVAIGVAISLSPLMPIGEARTFESASGVQFGWHLGVGALATILGCIALVVGGTLLGARKERSAWPTSVSPSASLVRALRFPPSLATGVRMALEGRRNTTSLFALLGVLVGSAGLVAALTFGSSLRHLDRSPSLVGWNWDLAAFLSERAAPGSTPASIEAQREEILSIPGVARASLVTFFPPQNSLFGDTEAYPMAFTSGVDSVLPTVVSGRAPAGPSDILLSPRLADSLGVAIGDVVHLLEADPANPGAPSDATRPFEVVGIGIVPLGDGRLDVGFSLTLDGLASVMPGSGPHLAVLDLAPGADARAVRAALETLPAIDEESVIGRVNSASDVVQLDTARVAATPRVAALLFALTSAAVLAHSVTAAGRKRRRELAILRALGMTARQATAASVWQATTAAIVSIAVSIPAGTAAGAALWSVYAHSLGVKVESSTSAAQIAIVVCSGLAGAAAVALLPARRAAGRATASTLREE